VFNALERVTEKKSTSHPVNIGVVCVWVEFVRKIHLKYLLHGKCMAAHCGPSSAAAAPSSKNVNKF
jgi:hypothetical protein